jgi:hypothetical protein
VDRFYSVSLILSLFWWNATGRLNVKIARNWVRNIEISRLILNIHNWEGFFDCLNLCPLTAAERTTKKLQELLFFSFLSVCNHSPIVKRAMVNLAHSTSLSYHLKAFPGPYMWHNRMLNHLWNDGKNAEMSRRIFSRVWKWFRIASLVSWLRSRLVPTTSWTLAKSFMSSVGRSENSAGHERELMGNGLCGIVGVDFLCSLDWFGESHSDRAVGLTPTIYQLFENRSKCCSSVPEQP